MTLPGGVDARSLSQLASMELRAHAVVEGHHSGGHRSPYRGASIEFADHRQYTHGDELRRLDWRLYGRTDRFFVKEHEAETNLNVYLALDASASMWYPERGVTKLSCAAYLAAGLAYLAHRQRDAAGLLIFSDGVTDQLPPLTARGHLQRIFETLDGLVPGGETDLVGSLAEVASAARRRGLVVLISDLLGDPESLLRSLAGFRHRGHDVIVFHVLDPSELEFDFRGPLVVEDMETGARMTTEAAEIRAEYLARMTDHLAAIRGGCHRRGIDYELFGPDAPFGPALTAYLARRSRTITRSS